MNTAIQNQAKNFNEYAANPGQFSSIEGVPAEIAARLPGFADFGLNGDKLVQAVREAGPEKGPITPGWANKLIAYGNAAIELGEKAEKTGDGITAEKTFLEASFWYFFARFPHILNAEAAQAYKLHTEAYLRACQHSEFSTEILNVPFADKNVRTILRFPKIKNSKLPVVILWGGIDVWKSDLEIHSLGNKFLEQGLAVLAIDMPGTGECPIPVSTTAQAWFFAVIECLKVDARIDNNRIGCYGLSFGGYWAAKLALLMPWLAGVVNNAGPIHYTFQPDWLNKLPFGIKAALARVCGLNLLTDSAALFETLKSLSLQQQNLLPTQTHVPLLSLNGEEDELVPIQDLHFLHEQGVKQDSLIFAHDRHVASRNWRLHEQFTAIWLAQKLRGKNNESN